MIVDLLLAVVSLLVDGLVLLLPSGEAPFADQFDEWAVLLRRWLFVFEDVIPISDQVTLIRWIAVVFFPGWLGYLGVKWMVSHIPFLGVGS